MIVSVYNPLFCPTTSPRGAASHYHGPGSPLYLRALFAVVGAALVRATMPADAILDPESNKGKTQGPHSLRETFRMHGRDLATVLHGHVGPRRNITFFLGGFFGGVCESRDARRSGDDRPQNEPPALT